LSKGPYDKTLPPIGQNRFSEIIVIIQFKLSYFWHDVAVLAPIKPHHAQSLANFISPITNEIRRFSVATWNKPPIPLFMPALGLLLASTGLPLQVS